MCWSFFGKLSFSFALIWPLGMKAFGKRARRIHGCNTLEKAQLSCIVSTTYKILSKGRISSRFWDAFGGNNVMHTTAEIYTLKNGVADGSVGMHATSSDVYSTDS